MVIADRCEVLTGAKQRSVTPNKVPKSLRLVAMIEAFRASRYGFTVDELAERFGVSARQVIRDLLDLQSEPIYFPLICEDERWKLFRY